VPPSQPLSGRPLGPRFDLHQRHEQQQLLLPRMIQAVEALELPAAELATWLREAYQQNEALRLVEAPWARRGALRAEQPGDDWIENQALAQSVDLSTALLEQVAWLDLTPEREEWVRFLIVCLDERGFLSVPDEELLLLAETTGLQGGNAALGLAVGDLQRLEPRGLGGRNQQEALLLQLDPRAPDYADLARLIEQHLPALERNKLPQVARALGRSLAELEPLLAQLRRLHPDPVAAWNQASAPRLEADLYVTPVANGFELTSERGQVPEVSLDPRAQKLASDPAQPRDLREYLRGRIERARWVIDAVSQRAATLERVGRAVFAHQARFLREGPAWIRPLTMNAVAEELGLHPSTISRAVAGKGVQTPFGILPLRSFFSAEFKPGSQQGRGELLAALANLVANENRQEPLSDDQLVEALTQQGFEVARRTVAKYRGELGLKSSYQRRQYGGEPGAAAG
jgi:RNA polymerase sigma-54 factor